MQEIHFHFPGNIASQSSSFQFILYLFEAPEISLEHIQNEEVILLSNLDSAGNADGYTHLLMPLRNGQETAWYPHILTLTSKGTPDRIVSGKHPIIVQTTKGTREVAINFTQPQANHQLEFGNSLSVKANFTSANNDPIPGVLNFNIKFMRENELASSVVLNASSVDGLIELDDPFGPNSAGEWSVEIEFSGNSELLPEKESLDFTVIPAESRLQLIGFETPRRHKIGQSLNVRGQLGLSNNNPEEVDLSGIPVTFSITDENSINVDTSRLPTIETDEAGNFSFNFPPTEEYEEFFGKEGTWMIQAHTLGNENIKGDDSEKEKIEVVRKRGYAILCQGSIPGEEGLSDHQKTINFIKTVFIQSGQFEDGKKPYCIRSV